MDACVHRSFLQGRQNEQRHPTLKNSLNIELWLLAMAMANYKAIAKGHCLKL